MYCDEKVNNETEECGGPIKPNITFFGEGLPEVFDNACMDMQINKEVDLLIVIGTALAVQPFCSVVDLVKVKTPKVLINMQNTESYDFDDKE